MIMVIGIGSGIDKAELTRIGGVNRFLLPSFDKVYDLKLVQTMVTKICDIGEIIILVILIRRRMISNVRCITLFGLKLW